MGFAVSICTVACVCDSSVNQRTTWTEFACAMNRIDDNDFPGRKQSSSGAKRASPRDGCQSGMIGIRQPNCRSADSNAGDFLDAVFNDRPFPRFQAATRAAGIGFDEVNLARGENNG